ncbi:hypothetical protein ABPG74_012125, partial [Tetrahymena malaccensis]
MDYIEYSNQIIAINYEEVILANPKTFKSEAKLEISNLMFANVIPKTQYVVLTQSTNQLFVYDSQKNQILSSQDFSQYGSSWQKQKFFYSRIFQFKCQDNMVIITGSTIGIFATSINKSNLTLISHGLINNTQSNYSQNSRVFCKHPEEDILFFGGYNYQIQAIKINSFSQTSYIQMMNTYLYQGNSGQFIMEIIFVTIQNQAYLLASNQQYIIFQPSYLSINSFWYFYHLENTTEIITCDSYSLQVYNYQTNQTNYRLSYSNDFYSRNFIYETQDQQLIAATINNNMYYSDKKALQDGYQIQSNKFSYNVYQIFNNIYKVKNCDKCILAKLRNKKNTDFISNTLIYPIQTLDNVFTFFLYFSFQLINFLFRKIQPIVTKAFQFSWDNVGDQLDPFYYNSKIWVVFSFKDKSQFNFTINGLFYLVNSQNTTEFYVLASRLSVDNQQNTKFAIASLFDTNNPQIIGADQQGKIYVWSLLKNYSFNQSFQLPNCYNPYTGEVFQNNKTQKLIVVCQGYLLYSFDFYTQDIQFLYKLSSAPLVISSFSNIQLIAVPDLASGIAYLFKYNFNSNLFDPFLQISSGQIIQNLIYIQLLKDNTLWLQYQFSYLFYNLQDCLNDVQICIQCTNSYYFNITNDQDQRGYYGSGSSLTPFTTSQSFFQSIIIVQNYLSIILGVQNIELQVVINPVYSMILSQELINIDFQSVISFSLLSSSETQLATIQYQNQLFLQNYNQIQFKNIQILFLTNTSSQCGLYFSNIQNFVSVNNIQLLSSSNQSISCQQIMLVNTYLQILNYTLSGQDFTNSTFLISTINSQKISIQNLTLINCILGDQFQIFVQNTDVQVVAYNLQLIQNNCSSLGNQNNLPLFAAGHYSVQSVQIINNTFCNKNIFQTIISYLHQNQTFTFTDISVFNNIFFSKTTYLFFDSLYSILTSPNHILNIQNANFNNNTVSSQLVQNTQGISFFQTDKIQQIYLKDVKIINHSNILLATFQYVDIINVFNFNCSNSNDSWLQQQNNTTPTFGCLQINEVQSVSMQNIYFDKKIAIDNSLFIISNKIQKYCLVNIINGQFTNLLLIQTQKNTYANPIQVENSYEVDFFINNTQFYNNQLNSIINTITYSTTGLSIQNYVGQVNIYNCSFANSQSNSKYNNLFVQSDRFQIISSNFTSSSFYDQILIQKAKESILNQYGGMVYATINSIQIQSCLFNQSTASKGSFLYIQSFGSEINIQINKTQFLEGYSFIDGSALFIDNLGYQFNLTCNDCLFENLFAFSPYSSQIGIQNYNLGQKNFSFLTFIGGGIKNFQGVIQSYFLNMQFGNIRFENVTNITSEEFSSNSFANIVYQREPLKEQSGLLNLISSQAYIYNTNISNFKIKNQQQKTNVLINSQNSLIQFKNSNIANCFFSQSLISLLGGSIVLDNTNFSNINLVSNQRILGDILNEQQNFANSYSLIVANNSQIQVLNKSTFSFINCIICNGGAFQMSNSNFNIQNSTFRQINGQFGGVIFITNLSGNNQIQDLTFQSCLSQYDGGSLYIQSQDFNGYSLNITSTQFYENHSLNGRGGAIFISSSLLNPKNASSNILNSQFFNNKAQIGGGLFYKNISLVMLNNTFENNNGLIYGNDSFSYPSKLIWLNIQNFTSNYNIQISDNSIEVFNFRSGDSLKNIQFQLINDQQQVIFPISEKEFETFDVQVKINPNTTNAQNYQIRGDQYIYFNKDLNVFQFEEITIVGVLGTSLIIQFFSNQIQNLDKQTNLFIQNYTFDVQINFRQCQSGEEIKKYLTYVECDICQPGSYSLDAQQCQDCPQGAQCKGGNQINVNQGYWRKSQQTALIIPCSNQDSNCVGGSYGNQVCYKGHIGALCEECD